MPSDRSYTRFSTAIPAGALKAIGKLNVPLYRASRGRLFGRLDRAPVLLLTTTGRKSGAQRTAPVVYLADGERMVVIGSNAGRMNDQYAGFDDYACGRRATSACSCSSPR